MSSELFLRQFERVVQTPPAVTRLRGFILELAVRGKLADRSSEDGTARDLLNRILAKRRDEGIRQSNSANPRARRAQPEYEIPSTWEWLQLGVIAEVVMGQSPPGSTYNKSGDGIPLINGPLEFTAGPFGLTQINQYTTSPTNLCRKGDLLLCVRGSTTGRTNIAAFDACIGRGVAALRPILCEPYVRLFIWRQRRSLIAMGRGIAFPSISRAQIAQLAVPLPPLKEQQRIVAKVHELMAMCDQLEAAEKERETRRDRLRVASLQRLTTADGDGQTSAADVRFFLDRSPRLITKPDNVSAIRQTILDLAVRGQLMPQDPEDGPASGLLARVKAAAPDLFKPAKGAERPASKASDRPFTIPASWEWARLGEFARLVRGVSFSASAKRTTPSSGFIACLRSGNVQRSVLWVDLIFVPNTVASPSQRVASGDILISIANSYALVGKTAIVESVPLDATFGAFLAAIRPVFVSRRYLQIHLATEYSQSAFRSGSSQTTNIANITFRTIRGHPVPVPPLAEQHRIVAKVDELMAVCDELEATLASAQDGRGRLLESLLQEALAAVTSDAPKLAGAATGS